MSVSLVTQHVALADFVFRTTDLLRLDSVPDNIGFTIVDIKIYESVNAKDYRISDTSMKHNSLMNAFSGYDFDDYCLAVAFTNREMG